MSNIQIISKIELLPNEILFECFKYLNGVDIFYSFDQLNYRFNQLIRSIPLYLNFRNVHRLLFNQFCNKILSNEQIKKQIYSLTLSNKSVYDQIEPFLSLFSFDEFPQLQSLAFIEVNSSDVPKLKLMLPLMCQLRSFRLFDTSDRGDELLSALPTFQLRALALPKLVSNLKLINQFSSLTNLTISECSTSSLCELLSTITSLKYLKVENVSVHEMNFYMWDHYKRNSYKNLPKDPSLNLKHLIIIEFQGEYYELEMILKRTPNLTNLTIHIKDNNIDEINANQLEHLIATSLPYLKIFKFIIRCSYNYSIENKFKEFQSDFWFKEHHWYTEYLLSKNFALIYTIPYMFDRYELIPYTKIYYNNLVNSFKTFESVSHLNIYLDALTEKCQYYFSHLTSLTLQGMSLFSKPMLTKTYIEHLKIIINLSNLKQLDISRCKLETPATLLKLLHDASQLSSLDIHSNALKSLFDDDELCKYVNKMITKLYIKEEPRCAMDDSCDLNKFCKTFSNIEQLICILDQLDSFLFLLKHLPKLSYINVFSFRFTCSGLYWLNKELNLSGKIISDYHYDNSSKYLTIWFTKNIS